MEDPILCRDVIECLLQHPVGTLTEGQTERELKYTSDGKPIRLDVYNEDDTGTVYDTEMENLDHKSVEYHQLPRRSRFYQSSIDIDFLKKGGYYKNLPVTIHSRIAHLLRDYGPQLRRFQGNRALRNKL